MLSAWSVGNKTEDKKQPQILTVTRLCFNSLESYARKHFDHFILHVDYGKEHPKKNSEYAILL